MRANCFTVDLGLKTFIYQVTSFQIQNPTQAFPSTMAPRTLPELPSNINSSTASQVQDTSSESGNEEELITSSTNHDVEVIA